MSKPHILIVEDDLLIAHGIGDLLRANGFDARITTNGKDAFRAIDEHEPDLIIMDIHLKPGPDGITIARQLSRDLDLPILFLTGDHSEKLYQDAISTVPYHFIRKPFPDAELINLVSMAVNFMAKRKAGEPRKDVWINKTSRGTVRLHLPDIYFVQARGAYTHIHLYDQNERRNDILMIVKSSNHVLADLAFPYLIKVHRSFHINLLRMDRYSDYKVYTGGQAIPVSKAYRAALQHAIDRL